MKARWLAGAAAAFMLAAALPSFAATTASTAIANSSLQTQIDSNSQQIADLNQKIAQYQAALTQVGADKKTLKAAIAALTAQRGKVEAQISVTQKQINTTQLQLQQYGTDIANTQQSIVRSQQELAKYFENLQQADAVPFAEQMLTSQSAPQAWRDIDALLQIQAAISGKMNELQAEKARLADSQAATQKKKTALNSQKQTLTAQQTSLAAAKKSQDELLAETSAQEAKYQALLASAKAQVASFSAFAKNAGGSGLLSNQTSCDSWGCYYNQRDSAWGNDSLDGTAYRLASDGCLVTSVAMVMTHYGYKDVTPQTINSNPDNFASYYPAFLSATVYVDGITATRKNATIDSTLSTGNPVIVGLHAYGGTHFIVLVSGSAGNYLMRDPYLSNGKDISFSAHYKMSAIYEINKVVISG